MSLQTPFPKLILASGSEIRRATLQGAGVDVTVAKSGVDEDSWKASMRADAIPPGEQAMQLAELKAQKVSLSQNGLVIGADQMLALGADIFDKPDGLNGVRTHLNALSGRTHCLETAVCIAEGGQVVWRHLARPKLTMRPLSPDFIDRYISTCDNTILQTVGGYQLEGLGSHLFSKIDGDYFAILGLPLLPLLDYLRVRGVLHS